MHAEVLSVFRQPKAKPAMRGQGQFRWILSRRIQGSAGLTTYLGLADEALKNTNPGQVRKSPKKSKQTAAG